MIIYGKNVIKEAILNQRPIYKLYVDEKLNDNRFIAFLDNKKISYVKTNKGELNKLSDNGIHNGVVADAKAYAYYDLEEVLDLNKNQRFLMLDEIHDPHNLGAILRSAEATGIDGIITAKNHQVPLTGVVAKSSSGATEYVKMIQVSNLYQTLLKLQNLNYLTIGTAGEATSNYKDIPKDRSLVIVMGNEGDGLRPLIKKGCEMLVSIPMLGKINSLNVSVATALLLYETLV